MPNDFGISFSPFDNQRNTARPGQSGAAPSPQEAIKILSLHVPRVVGSASPIPGALLNAPGSAGLGGPGTAQAPNLGLEELLRRLFGGGAQPGAGGIAPMTPPPFQPSPSYTPQPSYQPPSPGPSYQPPPYQPPNPPPYLPSPGPYTPPSFPMPLPPLQPPSEPTPIPPPNITPGEGERNPQPQEPAEDTWNPPAPSSPLSGIREPRDRRV